MTIYGTVIPQDEHPRNENIVVVASLPSEI